MLDLFELVHAAVAVLAGCWLRLDPAWRGRFGTRSATLMCVGAALPLLDYGSAVVISPDAIDFLARPRWMHSLPLAALWLAGGGLLASFVIGFRRTGRGAAWIGAGWALHLALDALTTGGIWLGVPARPAPFDWPAFSEGHWPLIVLFALGYGLLRAKPARAQWVRAGVWALAAVYLLGGIAQYGVVWARTAPLRQPGEAIDILPSGPWRTGWRVVVTDDAEHRIGELGPWGMPAGDLLPVARAADEAKLLALLADPVVRRYYFRVFRHPVTQVDESPVQLTLSMREAIDLDRGEPGATFTFETDLDGRERVYHVERFH